MRTCTSGSRNPLALARGGCQYTAFGFDVYKLNFHSPLLALLPVNNPANHYHATCKDQNGQFYVAVFLMKNRAISGEWLSDDENYVDWAKNKPFTLYFLGCDDGSYSKRFSSKQEAQEYLNTHTTLEAVIDDNIGNELYRDYYKNNKSKQPKEQANQIFDNYLLWEN